MPDPLSATRFNDSESWKRQSHRKLKKDSPVMHWEWILAKTGSDYEIFPIVIAKWSFSLCISVKAWTVKVAISVGRLELSMKFINLAVTISIPFYY